VTRGLFACFDSGYAAHEAENGPAFLYSIPRLPAFSGFSCRDTLDDLRLVLATVVTG
jgi:hypothetical protein